MSASENSGEAAVIPTDRNSSGRKAAIFVVYFLLGPPIGGLFLVAAVIAIGVADAITDGNLFHQTAGWGEIVGPFIFLTVIVMVWSYVVGGFQAAATGLIIAVYAHKDGRFGYPMAFIAPLAPSIVGALIFARDSLGFAVMLVFLGVASSLMLRFLFRGMFRDPE